MPTPRRPLAVSACEVHLATSAYHARTRHTDTRRTALSPSTRTSTVPHQCPCVSVLRSPYTCGRYSHRSALVTTAACTRGGTYVPGHASSATRTRWPTASATPLATRARVGPWLDRAMYATPVSSRVPRADVPRPAPVACRPSSSRTRTSRSAVSYMSYRYPHSPLLAYPGRYPITA